MALSRLEEAGYSKGTYTVFWRPHHIIQVPSHDIKNVSRYQHENYPSDDRAHSITVSKTEDLHILMFSNWAPEQPISRSVTT